jgi:hypothetical protein
MIKQNFENERAAYQQKKDYVDINRLSRQYACASIVAHTNARQL